jgi:acyl-coenzyme A synthetase/AMP-(fatty) acid ligase
VLINRWEMATAALRSGVIICPCTTLLVDKDIEYRVQVSGAKAFVGDETSVQKMLKVRSKCPSLRLVLQIGETIPKEAVDFRATLRTVLQDAIFVPLLDLKPMDPCLVFFHVWNNRPTKDGPAQLDLVSSRSGDAKRKN